MMLVWKADAAIALAAEPAHQVDPELVLAVLREVVRDQHPAPGAERETRHAIVLLRGLRHTVFGGLRRRRWRTERGAADPAGGAKILLETRLTDLQHARDVVEPEARIVRRQVGAHVHRQVEEITNRIAILGAIETMKGFRTPWVGRPNGPLIERRFQVGNEPGVLCLVGTSAASGR